MNSYDEQKQVAEKLREAISELERAGKSSALAEFRYRTTLSKFIALERLDGTPVTIIGDIARGEPEIARLRMERDIARAKQEAMKELVFTLRLELRIARDEASEDRKGI